ncbi:unnamed protein product [Psylliodes chrysocephalus]|uniref:Uncharacterized protein n=1 Tax=Psylliodes chrysocephalus TaxID=3402493 RepID=A0A9P0CS52_9CUCU|nr:unnamed protein product [Psylliodes chrysocephala]
MPKDNNKLPDGVVAIPAKKEEEFVNTRYQNVKETTQNEQNLAQKEQNHFKNPKKEQHANPAILQPQLFSQEHLELLHQHLKEKLENIERNQKPGYKQALWLEQKDFLHDWAPGNQIEGDREDLVFSPNSDFEYIQYKKLLEYGILRLKLLVPFFLTTSFGDDTSNTSAH